MIGLSLSFCVKDILSGKVAEKDVEKIIAGTMAKDTEDWNRVWEGYCEVYWKDNPLAAVIIAERLLEEGKIEQPRLLGGTVQNIADGWWKETA